LRLGIPDTHGFTPKLVGTLGFFYEHDDYSTTTTAQGFTEDTFNVNVGLRYALTPRLSLQANYQYTTLLSAVSSQEYNQNIVSVGANYSF
jgi:uncharacterized protein (PEP-CTERM system associated)